MKLFGFEIGRKAITREDILLEIANGGAGGTSSGKAINLKTALQVTTAFACARVIANGLAQVPFKVFQDSNGRREPATQHPLYDLLALQPNEWQTSYEMREQMALHLVFCGGAYIFKNRPLRDIVELLPYEPQQVTVKRNGWDLSYEVATSKGGRAPVAAEDMWHIRGPSWDGFEGLQAIKLAREALGLSLAMEEHTGKMFSNGARLGGILTTDKDLKPEQRTAIRESWQDTHAGSKNAYKTGILWGGLKWLSTAQQNDHAQLVEQRMLQIQEVCSALGVQPIMIGFSDKAATYASAEQMFLSHVVHCLTPYYTRIEQSATANLLTKQDRALGLYCKFLPQGLMRGDNKSRGEYFAKALGAGGSPAWMTQDEVRSLDELNPMGGNAALLREPTNVGTKAPATTDDETDPNKGA